MLKENSWEDIGMARMQSKSIRNSSAAIIR
jgi:hypothetical protein